MVAKCRESARRGDSRAVDPAPERGADGTKALVNPHSGIAICYAIDTIQLVQCTSFNVYYVKSDDRLDSE